MISKRRITRVHYTEGGVDKQLFCIPNQVEIVAVFDRKKKKIYISDLYSIWCTSAVVDKSVPTSNIKNAKKLRLNVDCNKVNFYKVDFVERVRVVISARKDIDMHLQISSDMNME